MSKNEKNIEKDESCSEKKKKKRKSSSPDSQTSSAKKLKVADEVSAKTSTLKSKLYYLTV